MLIAMPDLHADQQPVLMPVMYGGLLYPPGPVPRGVPIRLLCQQRYTILPGVPVLVPDMQQL